MRAMSFIFLERAIVRVFMRALVRVTARASVRDSSIPFVVDVMYDENYFEKFLNSPHFWDTYFRLFTFLG